MNRLCRFPFQQSHIGYIDTHDQNEDKQEAYIKSLCGKAVLRHPGKGLDILSDCVCRIRDKVQLVGFLHHIAGGIGDIHAHCPDKVGNRIESVLDTLSNAVQPVPRQPIPRAVYIEVKLIVFQRIF